MVPGGGARRLLLTGPTRRSYSPRQVEGEAGLAAALATAGQWFDAAVSASYTAPARSMKLCSPTRYPARLCVSISCCAWSSTAPRIRPQLGNSVRLLPV